MPGEIIHLQVGGCGNAIGTQMWEQLHEEHEITPEGKHQNPSPHEKLDVYYNETRTAVYQPRCILADLDPISTDYAMASKYSKLFKLENTVYSKTSGGKNWAKGYYSEGLAILEETMDAVRR